MIVDGLGSSEAGGQLSQVSVGAGATTGHVRRGPGNHVLSADARPRAAPGEDELGWLAKSGRLALGYLRRPGEDRADLPDRRRRALRRARATGPGCAPTARSSCTAATAVTINSGGEKIFAEEVEAALKAHPAVYDCVVAGRPSERWGNEVVAVVQLRDGAVVRADDLRAAAGAAHRPVQAAQGVRLRPRGGALAVGQGRLPLGARRSAAGRPDQPASTVPAATVGASRSDARRR